jgi:hypothetical protein
MTPSGVDGFGLLLGALGILIAAVNVARMFGFLDGHGEGSRFAGMKKRLGDKVGGAAFVGIYIVLPLAAGISAIVKAFHG